MRLLLASPLEGMQMVDTVTVTRRSEIMSRVRCKDTKPEMLVRRLVHGAGYRYRLHVSGLPGRPDLVFASRKKVIFIHGCFWHSHANCQHVRVPKSRTEFWLTKLRTNKDRDARNMKMLAETGWEVLVLWECELQSTDLLRKIREFLA